MPVYTRVPKADRSCPRQGQNYGAAETHLKILENGKDKLVNIANIVHDEAEEKLEDELIRDQ